MAVLTRNLVLADPSGRLVRIAGVKEPVRLCDVPLGKEYVEGGRVYQTSKAPSEYGRVPVGRRFRYGDNWFYRSDSSAVAKRLEPNMPFGKPSLKRGRDFGTSERVDILEISYRGVA